MKQIILRFLNRVLIKLKIYFAQSTENVLSEINNGFPVQLQDNKYDKKSYVLTKQDKQFINLNEDLEDPNFRMPQRHFSFNDSKKAIENRHSKIETIFDSSLMLLCESYFILSHKEETAHRIQSQVSWLKTLSIH